MRNSNMSVKLFFRTLIFSILVPGTVGGWAPYWIAHSGVDGQMLGKAGSMILTDSIGFALTAIGALIYLWCAYDFVFIGRGTPAPFAPPKTLVIRGLYKYVRNPMYVGLLLAIIGQGFIYGSPAIMIYSVLIFIMFHSFVVLYEEPVLRKMFGDDYLAYGKCVSRWLPCCFNCLESDCCKE